MEFSIKSASPEKLKAGCIVVGVYENNVLTPQALAVDKASNSYLSDIIKRGDLEGKANTSILIHHVPGIQAERVLLVGLGKADEFNGKSFRDAVAHAILALKKTGASNAAITLTELEPTDCAPTWRARQAAMVIEENLYRFDQMRSKKEENGMRLSRIDLTFAPAEADAGTEGAKQGAAIASGMTLARDLGNLPSNICTPSYLAGQAEKLAKQYKLKCEVLDRAQMEKVGMGALLAVAKGSHEAPRFIVLQYRGGKGKDKPVVLVGKGITFDTGGISLKPAAEMDEMKYDMCGAASVLGTFKTCAELQIPLNMVGLIPTTENMPGGSATKPGDIVTSLSGQTIEILNTDAEGRLILCDALTYAARFQPDSVIDIATLTGACVIALGHVATGLLANNDELAAELLDSGRQSHDRAWQLPLWEDYQEQLKSPFADMANIGGRPAGSITAASFLARYTKEYRWAHLDIAGTAWKSGKDKGATGRPVPLLTHYLLKRAGRL